MSKHSSDGNGYTESRTVLDWVWAASSENNQLVKFELQTLEEYSDDAILAELRRVAGELNGQRLTIERFNSLSRVHSTTLRYRFGTWQAALDKAGISESIAPRFRVLSRDAVINALRLFISENPGKSPTVEEIAERLGVNKTTIPRRFGRWDAILAEVGLTPVPLGRRYTEDDCFENLLALWTHFGRQPIFRELNQPPSTVGSKAYVLRWGGWRAALAAFVKRVNESPEARAESTQLSPVQNQTSPEIEYSPRSINLAMRYRVLVRDKFRCVICGASPANKVGVELHVDHIHPWSKGGQNVENNLRTLCLECNLGKGDKLENV